MKRTYLQPFSEVVSLEMEGSTMQQQIITGSIDQVGWDDTEQLEWI
jgi:hypothetical protein